MFPANWRSAITPSNNPRSTGDARASTDSKSQLVCSLALKNHNPSSPLKHYGPGYISLVKAAQLYSSGGTSRYNQFTVKLTSIQNPVIFSIEDVQFKVDRDLIPEDCIAAQQIELLIARDANNIIKSVTLLKNDRSTHFSLRLNKNLLSFETTIDLHQIKSSPFEYSVNGKLVTDIKEMNFSGLSLRGVKFPHGIKLSRQQVIDILETANNSDPTYPKPFAGVDLSGLDLSNLRLYDADFRGANLAGTNFAGANLARANFERANLKDANLERTNLARANFERANLKDANFDYANLERANLIDAEYEGKEFDKAKLPQVRLSREQVIAIYNRTITPNLQMSVRLTLDSDNRTIIDFSGMDLSKTKFNNAEFYKNVFSKTNFSGAELNCTNFYGSEFRNVNFEGAKLKYAQFVQAKLDNVNFEGADLENAGFGAVNLSGANLKGANLKGADLRGADLRGADLRGADLREADLRWADLREADLRGADLRETNFTKADLNGVRLSREQVMDICDTARKAIPPYAAPLAGVDLSGVDLSMANFSGANLNGVRLSREQVMDICDTARNAIPPYAVPLAGVDLSGVDLRGVDLRRVNLSNANLIGVIYNNFTLVDRTTNITNALILSVSKAIFSEDSMRQLPVHVLIDMQSALTDINPFRGANIGTFDPTRAFSFKTNLKSGLLITNPAEYLPKPAISK